MNSQVLLGSWVVCFAMTLVAVAAEPNDLSWPATTREHRPWTYNWWMGSAVDRENLAKELRRYRDGGLGGVHIIPIYGAKGAESRYIPYLSPKWMEMLQFCIEEAGKLGLGVDMTTGTGWCFGGPRVAKEEGGWLLKTGMVEVAAGAGLGKVDKDALVGLVAVGDDGRQVNLKERLKPDGTLDWKAEGKTKVYQVTAAARGPKVKRSSPGGEGLMINPLSPVAMKNYLQWFIDEFAKYSGPLPRAMYHDSYEYNSEWIPGMLEEFARRRGYRLEEQWPAFCGDVKKDQRSARVRCDYQETVSDLMIEAVFPQWIQWCKSRGIMTRNEAHGSPGNLLDLYALADVPETEMFGRGTRDPLKSRFDDRFNEGDRNPLISKFASSAAHVAGRKLVSAETGTWMAEHFCETLEEMKCLVDLLFASGVNHVVYHGTCYSPDDAAWPGWLFYASTQMNPRNAIWRDAPTLNTYIERCQSLLQSGRPDNDVLLYWPIHEMWSSTNAAANRLTVHNHEWLTEQPVGATAKQLWEGGWGFDYVSDRQLSKAQVDASGSVILPGAAYRVVLVPPARILPLETVRKLLAMAADGATVMFQDRLPEDVPGAAKLDARQTELKTLLAPLKFEAASKHQRAKHGRGGVLVGELRAMLGSGRFGRETICNQAGVRFIRRRNPEGCVYFIANQSPKVLDEWFQPARPAASVVVMDPLIGRTGVIEVLRGKGEGSIRLRLEPGQSIILRTFDQRVVKGPAWHWVAPAKEQQEIKGLWKVEFVEGGPVLPKPYEAATPQSWTTNSDAETQRFAGTAVYSTEFDAPAGDGPWVLDLGTVCHSARVRLNGEEIGRLIMPPYRLPVAGLKSGKNRLEVEVTNLSANRIRDLDHRKVEWRIFHDINLVNINYKKFDASDWPVLDSGLLGPVMLGK